MSIRSHYSKDSYTNRPLTNGGSRRNRTPSPIPVEALPPEDNDMPVDCKRCPYKRLVDKALIETEDNPTEQATYRTKEYRSNVEPITRRSIPAAEPVDEKPRGLFKRFGDYIAKNQAANKAAGETSLTEDLMNFGKSYGKGLSDGAASLGMEEIANINKKKSIKRTEKEDDELINFLSGKRKRQ